jgi:Ca-activated chloride channel homolog
MRPTHVAIFAALGMMLTSISVYSLAPGASPSARKPDAPIVPESIPSPHRVAGDPGSGGDPSRFTAGSRLVLEGRVGNARVPRSARENFLMFEVRTDGSAGTRTQASLSLVIDRSGSMKGSRLANAVQAAATAVDRLNDGDVVSVVTFDTRTAIVVPPTTLGATTRTRILAGIRGITLGGDTCISCGIDDGLDLLAQTTDRVSRMIVLSDGDANHGVRDIPGFRAIAQRARDRGVSITTIGVDVDYNEKIMSVIAQESNGGHYFVENDAGLAKIFEAEAEHLTTTIANGAEIAVDLAPGVELDRVFDRSFRRDGARIVVPLGTFAAGDVKTVLLKVRLGEKAVGASALASADLSYRDLAAGNDAHATGKLGVEVTGGADASELDAIVAGRVQRTGTANALKEANFLFEQGRLGDARHKLDEQQLTLQDAADKAKRAAPAGRALEVQRDFDSQIAALNNTSSEFAGPKQAFAESPAATAGSPPDAPAPAHARAPAPERSREGKSAVRRAEVTAVQMAR